MASNQPRQIADVLAEVIGDPGGEDSGPGATRPEPGKASEPSAASTGSTIRLGTMAQLEEMDRQERLAKPMLDNLGRHQTFETFRVDDLNREAWKYATRMASGDLPPLMPGLFFIGPVGTGKTHLAYAVANRWPKEKRGAVYVSSSDLMDRLREAVNGGSEATLAWVLERYTEAGLLIIDDLGVEKQSEWTQDQLFKLVNHRLRNLSPTIATSNFPTDALADRIGVRVVSRLQEMCETVELLGEDRRLVK